MNFTEMNKESTLYAYVRGQIANQISPDLYAILDRNTALPIWEQVWTHTHWNTHNKLNGR